MPTQGPARSSVKIAVAIPTGTPSSLASATTEARGAEMRLDPGTNLCRGIPEGRRVDLDNAVDVRRHRRADPDSRRSVDGPELVGSQAHAALPEAQPAEPERPVCGHTDAPWHAAAAGARRVPGTHLLHVYQGGIGDVTVVPLRVRQSGRHQAYPRKFGRPAAHRLAQAALRVPGVAVRRPHALDERIQSGHRYWLAERRHARK